MIGFVHGIDAMKCGLLSAKLGGNRIIPGSKINHAVGLVLHTRVGEEISKGKCINFDMKKVNLQLL
jgi:pyrimidine-nucleoside phosphorylase